MRLIFAIIFIVVSSTAIAAHPGKVDFDDLVDLRGATSSPKSICLDG